MCFLKDLPANSNCDCAAVIILPTPFEAVFVRINPTAWQNSIALKVECYGCKLDQPVIPGKMDNNPRFARVTVTTCFVASIIKDTQLGSPALIPLFLPSNLVL